MNGKVYIQCSVRMKNFFAWFWLLFCNVCFPSDHTGKSLAYDANGNISEYTTPFEEKNAYSYDPINRLTEIRYPNGEIINYTYDYNSNLIKAAKGSETTSYSYDALNRLKIAQFPGNVSISYDYDSAGRILKIIYPDKEEVRYKYDSRSRLIVVSDQTGNTQYEYDDLTNLVVKERLANGVVTEYSYDSSLRISTVSHKKSNGDLIVENQFTYDSNNNCTSIKKKTSFDKKNTIYSYDNLNRLIEVSYGDSRFERYIYDGAGNRLSMTTQDGTIDYEYDNYNRLIRVGEAHFYYDALGNLIKKTARENEAVFGYDSIGRLISYDNGKNKVSFAYDGEGRRISKTVNGKKTSFINDPVAPLSRVLLEKDEEGRTKKRYVYGFSRVLGQGPTNTQFFLYDQPGKSVAFVIDKSQRLLENYGYSAFGFRNEKSDLENCYGYAGEEYEEETGLIYLRNRYYDPEIGRFISPDFVLGILDDPQTLNALRLCQK
jgi:RHS repeat-associated protein